MVRDFTKELKDNLAAQIPSIARAPLSEQTRKEMWNNLAHLVEKKQGNPKVMLPNFMAIMAATLDLYERGDLFHTLESWDEWTGEIFQYTLWKLPTAARADGAQTWVDPLADNPDMVFWRASIYDEDKGEFQGKIMGKERINGKTRTVYLSPLPREVDGSNADRTNKQNCRFPAFPGLTTSGQLSKLGLGSYETCESVPMTDNSKEGYIPLAIAKVIASILEPDAYGDLSHDSEKAFVMTLLGLHGLIETRDDNGNVVRDRVRPLEMTNMAYVELICNIGTLFKYTENSTAIECGLASRLDKILDDIKQHVTPFFKWEDLEKCAKEIKYGLPGVLDSEEDSKETFIVNHKDNNPRNNCVYNLEVATQKSNRFHEAVVARALLSRYRDTICERDPVSGKIVLSRDFAISIYQIKDFVGSIVSGTVRKLEASDVESALRNDCDTIRSVGRGHSATQFFNEYSSPRGICYEEISLETVRALKKLRELSTYDLIKFVDCDINDANQYREFVDELVTALPQSAEDKKILTNGLYDRINGDPLRIVTGNKICSSKIVEQSTFSLFISWLLAHGWGKGALGTGSTYGSAFNASPDVTCMVDSYEDDYDEGGAAL